MATRIGSLCSGYEGLGMAVMEVLGGELAWVADNDKGATAILAHRFPSVPNLGDITATDWAAVEPVDILTAGFPCQDVSCAGARAGLRAGNRTGVWSHVATAIRALRPSLVVLENVGGLLSESADSDMELCPWCLGDTDPESAMRALGAVLADLAEAGLDADWCCVRASDVGAPHKRERVFITAWPAADAESPERRGIRRDGQPGPAERKESGDITRPAGDSYGTPSDEWRRQSAAGQAEGGRSHTDARGPGGASAADAERDGLEGRQRASRAREGGRPAEAGGGQRPAGGPFPSLAAGVGKRRERAGSPEGGRSGPAGSHVATEWGQYAAAVARWERTLGRPAPRPVEPGRTGERLSPRFVEWMMGLPDGWVTDVPGLKRNAQLKALGNGVVPQQAALALRLLLADVLERAA